MRHLFLLSFFAIIVIDVFSVIDSTIGVTPILQKDGVRVARQTASVDAYSYLVFTNDNDTAVSVTYEVDGQIVGVIHLQVAETKRSHTAYADKVSVDIKVKRENNNPRRGEWQHRKIKVKHDI